MDFEKANTELEQIIQKLEDENTTLSEGVALYERAQLLIKNCEQELKQAKSKIQVLKDEQNENF